MKGYIGNIGIGKENGNYYLGLRVRGLGFMGLGLRAYRA